MTVRFWTLLFLVSLACIFKKKWNPVSGNHNPNVTHTIFSLSVIKEPAIKSIWCSTSFDRQLHKLALLLLRHSPKLDEFTAFRRRYRVESRPSSKARKNRKHVYKSMSSKKELKISHVRRPSQPSLSTKHFHILFWTIMLPSNKLRFIQDLIHLCQRRSKD